MQLLLNLDDRAGTLLKVHRRLLRRFGHSGPFLRLDPVSQLVLSLIGGRTRGAVSQAAFQVLQQRFGCWEAVRDAPVAEIHAAIRTVTFADVKAAHLKAALTAITAAEGRLTLDRLDSLTVADALLWLEGLPGVGRKVGAATLNFSTLRKKALVIDTHHLRVLARLGFVDTRCSFQQAYDRIVPLLPAGWRAADFDEHHQRMKRLGQTLCRPGAMACRRCPLYDLCPTASARL